jgi:[CysO sulfur-carrier protein]-thiocarboxylate-dependent cysteine synthase
MLKIEQKLQKELIFSTVNRELGSRPDIKEFLFGTDKLVDIFSLENDLSDGRVAQYRKAYFGVGNTECYKLNLPNDNKLFLKMEYTNAMGNNHYSRFWVVHLFICEVLGVIHPGITQILEVTSGSSGISLAVACEELGFDVTILVPSLLPENRIQPMRRSTTTIVEVPGYIDNCIAKLKEMVKEGNYYVTNHSEEKADVITHVFSRIGYELVRDVGFPIDYAVLAMGNGTSTMAIGKALKESNENIKITAYRPHFEENPEEIVFGLIAANIDCRHIPLAMGYVDNHVYTSGVDIEALRSRYKCDTEIRNLGYSSLYGLHFAHELAKTVEGRKIVTVGYDKMDRY